MQAITNRANPSPGVEEGLSPCFWRPVVVRPPFVVDTQLGVSAFECPLDPTRSGTDHQIVVAIDQTQPCHHQFAVRLRGMFKLKELIHVIPLPSGP